MDLAVAFEYIFGHLEAPIRKKHDHGVHDVGLGWVHELYGRIERRNQRLHEVTPE